MPSALQQANQLLLTTEVADADVNVDAAEEIGI